MKTNEAAHDTVSARLNREEQNMLVELSNGLPCMTYNRAQMVVARRLARKGLVAITRKVYADGSAATWVRRTDWEFLCASAEES